MFHQNIYFLDVLIALTIENVLEEREMILDGNKGTNEGKTNVLDFQLRKVSNSVKGGDDVQADRNSKVRVLEDLTLEKSETNTNMP